MSTAEFLLKNLTFVDFLWLLPVLFFYFLPYLIGRKKPDFKTLFVINLLAGWSIIGWVFSLYLALRSDSITSAISSGANATSKASVADEIIKLHNLCDQGVLTQTEFERQKNNLLS
ncbi:superinfection immunity protein [Hymenobacter sp. BT491]|uniref:superinfection immunity protein n=1 Tax=Hymenobacter sp. BT491 TaxID=2766779 RepID=UPI001CA3C101|nr:superinfection immunity protein [Hymenobacter sp. BT491]